MLVISYDISNDKLRTQFSKLLEQYGERIQYSVFGMKNSERLLHLLINKIDHQFKAKFSQEDSVFIFSVNDNKTITYGHAGNLGKDFLYFE